jgi:hypothetical protein
MRKMDGGVFSTAFVFAVDRLFSRAPGGRAYEAHLSFDK